MKTEEKTKVVAAAWGAESIKFYATLAILHRTICRIGCIAPGRYEEWDEFILVQNT